MKYIVSNLAEVQPGNGIQEYNHDAVKLAYKAGAVVEFEYHLSPGWSDPVSDPSFPSGYKYRAIVTDDMPKEIQDMVNYIGDLPISCAMQELGRGYRTTEPQPHKWKDVIIAMANGETAQWLHAKGKWFDGVDYNPMSYPEYEWRIKPRTINIGDIEVPAPETKAPEAGTKYFVTDALEEERLYQKYTWANDEFDRHALRSGVIHLTQQAAQEHALALIKISGGQHPENYEVAK